MKYSREQLISELSLSVDPLLAAALVEAYIEMQKRFIAGDWGPAELNGGRLCEAAARCLYQLDFDKITHSKLPGKIMEELEKEGITHKLKPKQRFHITKVIGVVYKFRSDRGAVHISPEYTADYMDSMLMIHASKWIFAELLHLAWNKDKRVLQEIIENIVQLDHSLIHEMGGKPLVLAKGISAPEEILLLLNHAPGNQLSRADLKDQAHQKPGNITTALTRMIKTKEIRTAGDEIALTPSGQKRVREDIIPKWLKS